MSILLPEGYQLLFKHTVDSTNTELKRLMQHGAPEHTVLCAIEQSAGRGRHGRSWESLNGNLFCSWSVRIKRENYAVISRHLPYIVGLALCRTLPQCLDIVTKWPNDILIGDKKIAGILMEARMSGKYYNVVIGTGVNTQHFPWIDEVACTSLVKEGMPMENSIVLSTLLHAFEAIYTHYSTSGFEPVRDAWLSYCNHIPGNGAITCNGELHKGTYKTISPDGSLVFQTDTEELTVTSGEVFPEHSALCYS